ncbi:MAG: hypothetical protein LUC22_03315 [Prevotella sp.]|nr:hypothetical protein [Prevotella sp.]
MSNKHAHTKHTNICRAMVESLKRAFGSAGRRRFIKKWTARTDGDDAGLYYVKRRFDTNFTYFDLYWEVKLKENHKHIDTLYKRAEKPRVVSVIKETEEAELKLLFANLTNEAERREK